MVRLPGVRHRGAGDRGERLLPDHRATGSSDASARRCCCRSWRSSRRRGRPSPFRPADRASGRARSSRRVKPLNRHGAFQPMSGPRTYELRPGFDLSIDPNPRFVSTVRRFVEEAFDRLSCEPDAVFRVAMTAHELLENAAKYSLTGPGAAAVLDAPGGRSGDRQPVADQRDHPGAHRAAARAHRTPSAAPPIPSPTTRS